MTTSDISTVVFNIENMFIRPLWNDWRRLGSTFKTDTSNSASADLSDMNVDSGLSYSFVLTLVTDDGI